MSDDHEESAVRLTVNGAAVACAAAPRATLQELLHGGLGRAEVKLGCGEGVCGACVVLVDGEPRASCLMLARQAEGRAITTAAGLAGLGGEAAEAHGRLVAQVVARESFQCGYCAPGFMVSATALALRRPPPGAGEVRRALSGHLCRCSGYQPIVEAVVAAAAGEPPPPTPDPRPDVREKALGATRYPTDRVVEGQLVGKVLWSEHAAARITSIDVEAARAVPGVELVLTHLDVPGENVAGETLFAADQPLLASGEVRCRGDAIALVAARSEAAAREALGLIEVCYEPLPSVHHVLDALAPSAPDLGGSHNVIAQFTKVRGDVDAQLAEADVVVEGTYESGPNDHVCMEPEGGAGRWDGDTLELTITSLTPHAARAGVAAALGLPEERIRVEAPRMGGSFGKYLTPGVEALLALLAARAPGPVRLVLERREIFERRPKRHPFWGRYRLGLRRDGAFLALDADVIADAGAYVGLTPAVVSVFADEVAGAYEVPAIRAVARGVLTNNLVAAPMRGFGSQQINFGVESIIEKAARAVGMDPAVVRAMNFVRRRTDGQGGEIVDPTIALPETLRRTVEALGPRPPAEEGWAVGRGVASVKCKYGYPYGMIDRFVARVTLERGGRFSVESDVPDSGTGILAGAARLVARELGLARAPEVRLCEAIAADPSGVWLATGRPPSRLRRWLFRLLERLQGVQAAGAMNLLVRTRPRREALLLRVFARPINAMNALLNRVKLRLFPCSIDSFVPRTSGSRGMLMVGRAAVDAAARLRGRALDLAATVLGAPAGALACDDAGVHVAARPHLRVAWGDLAERAGGSMAAIGQATIPPGVIFAPGTGNQTGAIDHMFATHGVDLMVHRATGEVRILRYVACQDVGKALNPEAVRGQMLGSIAMGVGQALFEKMTFDEGGAPRNGTMLDYHIPTSLDAPADPVLIVLESGGGRGPLGSKGVGEAGAVASPIAVANALYDALGVQVAAIPVTAEDLARSIEGRGCCSTPR